MEITPYEPQFDHVVSRLRYNSGFHKKSVLVERNFPLEAYTDQRIVNFFRYHKLTGLCGPVREAKVNLVREFYSSFPQLIGCSYEAVINLRGTSFTFSDNLIATFFNLPRVENCPFGRMVKNHRITPNEVISTLYGKPKTWDGKTQITSGRLTPFYAFLNEFVNSNILPRVTGRKFTKERAYFLYGLGKGIKMDIPKIIFDEIFSSSKYKDDRKCLPFGSLITEISEFLCIQIGESELSIPPAQPVFPEDMKDVPTFPDDHHVAHLLLEQGEPSNTQDSTHEIATVIQRIDQLEATISTNMTVLSNRIESMESLLTACHTNINRICDYLHIPPPNQDPAAPQEP